MSNWVLTHCVGSVRKVSFTFPTGFAIKSKQNIRIWAKSKKINSQVEDLVFKDVESWTHGSQDMFIRIENEHGEEKACYRKTS